MEGKQILKLDMNTLPKFIKTNLRKFSPGEVHITRTCAYDVLIIMLDGELIFYENGRRVSLQRGQWYIQRNGLFQEGREASKVPSYYFIHFNGNFSEDGDALLPLEGKTEVEQLLPILQELFNTERSFYSNQISCNALFFSVLSKLYGLQYESSHSQRLLRKMEHYLNHNYMFPHALDRMANDFHLSKVYITRLFRQQLQLTPHQYLTRIRIDQACQMMLDTNRTINDIAFEIGYQDVSSFYRAFTKQKSCAPRKWREHAYNNLEKVLGNED